MEDTAKVEGHSHLVRDLKSSAIINTDSSAYARYMARKTKQKEMNDEIQNMLNYQEQILNARREQLQELIAEQHRFDGAED